jgi:RecB family exonuclease
LGPRSILCEQKLDSSFCEQPFRFIADRLDVTAKGDYIIWDYKTGSTNTTKLPTAIKNNFIQLPLYKELVDRLAPHKKSELGLNEKSQCLGFAYLSPLKREKSVYYFTSQTESLFKELAELEGAAAHPLIQDEVEPLTQEKVMEALQILQKGEFVAQPRKKNDCFTCPARFACGRPFLAREVDEDSPEELTL